MAFLVPGFRPPGFTVGRALFPAPREEVPEAVARSAAVPREKRHYVLPRDLASRSLAARVTKSRERGLLDNRKSRQDKRTGVILPRLAVRPLGGGKHYKRHPGNLAIGSGKCWRRPTARISSIAKQPLFRSCGLTKLEPPSLAENPLVDPLDIRLQGVRRRLNGNWGWVPRGLTGWGALLTRRVVRPQR